MEVSVISIPDGLPKWHLVASFLRFRKEVFIGKLSWELHHMESMEFEQYDRINAVYVIAHEGDRVLGGARLLRTDHKVGIYSYMLRDAYLRLLPGIPHEICEFEPPQATSVWELTRLAATTAGEVAPAILRAANDYLKSAGANDCLFLGPPAFLRMAKSMAFDPRPLGRLTGNKDGRFLAFSCSVV